MGLWMPPYWPTFSTCNGPISDHVQWCYWKTTLLSIHLKVYHQSSDSLFSLGFFTFGYSLCNNMPFNVILYCCLSGKLWYLQHNCAGDPIVYRQGRDILLLEVPAAIKFHDILWWYHQMETFSALLALCEGNPLVTSGFPSQRLVT